MLNPHELRTLEIDAELAKLHATHVEARSKMAALESQRALLTPHSQIGGSARSGLGFWSVLAIAIVAALAGGALLGSPDHNSGHSALNGYGR